MEDQEEAGQWPLLEARNLRKLDAYPLDLSTDTKWQTVGRRPGTVRLRLEPWDSPPAAASFLCSSSRVSALALSSKHEEVVFLRRPYTSQKQLPDPGAAPWHTSGPAEAAAKSMAPTTLTKYQGVSSSSYLCGLRGCVPCILERGYWGVSGTHGTDHCQSAFSPNSMLNSTPWIRITSKFQSGGWKCRVKIYQIHSGL